MRTFIAINIPDEVRQQMAGVQRVVRSANVEASWPRTEGMHLTLKFLGEVPDAKIPGITNALTSAVQPMSRFRLEIRGTGAFPNPGNARVVWIGISGDLEKLNILQAAVEDAMVRAGMEPEDRAFKPHLTIGRIKYIRSKESWLKALEQVRDVSLPGFEVNSISLMKSELKRTGAEYTEIAKVELK